MGFAIHESHLEVGRAHCGFDAFSRSTMKSFSATRARPGLWPIGLAAALPVARSRWLHFTALATLDPMTRAEDRSRP